MIKENRIIPVGSVENVPNYNYGKNVALKIFNLVDKKEAYLEILNKNLEVVSKFKVLKDNNTIIFDIEFKDEYIILLN